MKTLRAIMAVVLLVPFIFTGCESTQTAGGGAVSNTYYSDGFYDPWYYGGDWDDPNIIVTPPPERPDPPARPEQPIAKPPPATAPRPTPLPSIPAAPRPMPRPAMRR